MLTHDYEKPEMPEPDGSMTIMMIGREVEIDTYRASTMVEYRDACVEAATAPLLARIAELEQALAECRDAYPVPEAGSELESLWGQAMGEPASVIAYVKARSLSAAPAAQPMTASEIWASDEIMEVNADAQISFEHIQRFVKATERHHGIKEQP